MSKFLCIMTFLLVGVASPCFAGQAIGEKAISDIVNTMGESIGTAEFTQGNSGILIEIHVKGLTPGKHGMHFHEVGIADHQDRFKSAKGHIMPSGRPHGFLNPKGPHEGNLPNLIVREDGSADVELYSDLVSISGRDGKPALLDSDGATLIIHANPDDQTTQPIGGSGARVAGGVIRPSGTVK